MASRRVISRCNTAKTRLQYPRGLQQDSIGDCTGNNRQYAVLRATAPATTGRSHMVGGCTGNNRQIAKEFGMDSMRSIMQ